LCRCDRGIEFYVLKVTNELGLKNVVLLFQSYVTPASQREFEPLIALTDLLLMMIRDGVFL
jgi:hypothetical protein